MNYIIDEYIDILHNLIIIINLIRIRTLLAALEI